MSVAMRIYTRASDGSLQDNGLEFDVSDFAGIVPQIGDMILDPGVPQGQDRLNPSHRRLWTVRQRVFNPHDHSDYVLLVVDESAPSANDRGFVI